MEAIEYVLQVVEFALQKQNRPRYDFLVYNSSMIYWRIARSLMKVKTIRFLISSLTTIIDALKIVSEADILWVARLKVTLAQAFIDDGQNACAAQFTAEVVEKMLLPFYIDTAALNKISSEGKREAHRLFQDALILQHYFSTINEPECRKLSITAANNATQFSTKLESKHYMVLLRLETLKFTGQAEDVSKELCQIFIESTGLKDYEASTISRKGLKAHCKITAAGSNVAISADDQLVVEIGIFALSRGIFDVAVHCEAVVKMSMDEVTPHLLLLHRFLCTMLHIECDELYAAFNQKVPRGKPHSMDKVKWMNKLLTYCARMQCKSQNSSVLDEIGGIIERVCVYAWCQSQAMREEKRKLFCTTLHLANSLMESCESLLHFHRVQIALEMARLNLEAKRVGTAKKVLEMALTLDYGSLVIEDNTFNSGKCISGGFDQVWALYQSANDAQKPHFERSLDAWVVLLHRKVMLEIKRSATDTSEDVAEIRDIAAVVHCDQVLSLMDEAKSFISTTDKCKKHVEHSSAEKLRVYLDKVLKGLKRGRNMIKSTSSVTATLNVLQFNELSAFSCKTAPNMSVTWEVCREALSQCNALHSLTPSKEWTNEQVSVVQFHLYKRTAQLLALKLEQLSRKQCSLYPTRNHSQITSTVDASSSSIEWQHLFTFGAVVNESSDSFVRMATRLSGDSEIVNAVAVLEIKKTIFRYLTELLEISQRTGFGNLLRNAGTEIWNHHLCAFERLWFTGSASSLDWIAPESINLLESIASELEVWSFIPNCKKNSLEALRLWLSVSLAIAFYYEKAGQLDQSLLLCDNVLAKRTNFSSFDCLVNHRLKYFIEIRTRSHIGKWVQAKGATLKEKEVGAMDDAFLQSLQSPILQCIALIEAMTYYASSGTDTPTYDKMMDGLYQKVNSIAPLTTSGEKMEPIEQNELKIEVLVRLGWCALCHFQQPGFAIDCCQHVIKWSSEGPGDARSQSSGSNLTHWIYNACLVAGKAVFVTVGCTERVSLHILLQAIKYFVKGAEVANYAGLPTHRSAEFVRSVLSDALTNQQSWEPLDHTEFCDAKGCEINDIPAFRAVVIVKIRRMLELIGRYRPRECEDVRLELILIALRLADNDWPTASSISKEYWEDFEQCSRVCRSEKRPVESKMLHDFVRLSAIAAFQVAQRKETPVRIEEVKALSLLNESIDPLMTSLTLQKIATACGENPHIQLQVLVRSIQEIQSSNPKEMAQLAQLFVESAEWLYSQGFHFSQVQNFYHLAIQIYPIRRDSELVEDEQNRAIPSRLKHLLFQVRVTTALAMASPTWEIRRGYIMAAHTNVLESWRNITLEMSKVHDELQMVAMKDSSKPTTSSKVKQEQNGMTGKIDSGIKYELGGTSQNPADGSADFLSLFSTFELSKLHRFRHEWKRLVDLDEKKSISLKTNDDSLLHKTVNDRKGELHWHASCVVITCYYLKKLLQLLRDEEMEQIGLPIICLHDYLSVCLYADRFSHTETEGAIPSTPSRDIAPASQNVVARKPSCILCAWTELMVFRFLSAEDRPALASIALDQALELVHNHIDMYNELQLQAKSPLYQKLSSEPVVSTLSYRTLLSAKAFDLLSMAISIVEMLLELGYTHESSCVLEVINKVSASDGYCTRQWDSVIVKLMIQVKIQQGNIEEAIILCERYATEPHASWTELSVSHYVDLMLTLAQTFVEQRNMTRSLEVLHVAERNASFFANCERQHEKFRLAAHETVASLETCATKIGIHGEGELNHELKITREYDHDRVVKTIPLPLLCSLARVKLAKARLLIFAKWHTLQETSQSAYNRGHDGTKQAMNFLNDAKRLVRDGMRLTEPAGYAWILIRSLILYQNALQGMLASHANTLQMKDYASHLEELKFVQNYTRGLLQHLHRDLAKTIPEIEKSFDGQLKSAKLDVFRARIDSEIAIQQLKQVDLRLSQALSFYNVKFHEMTWFEHQKHEKLSVVDRWLLETDSDSDVLQEANKRIFPHAKKYLSAAERVNAAIAVLTSCSHDEYALAGCIFRSQLQRLHLFHGNPKLYKHCWTRYTSCNNSKVTWIVGNRKEEALTSDVTPVQEIPTEEQELGASLSNLLALISDLQSQQKLAFDKNNANLIARSSYELLQCFSLKHFISAIDNLCLYQACVARKKLENLLLKSGGTHTSHLLHLRRMQKLQLDDGLLPGFLTRMDQNLWTPFPTASQAFKESQRHLSEDWKDFKQMQLSSTCDLRLAFSLLPPDNRIIILQLSPEKAFLFGAYVSPASFENLVHDLDYTALTRMEVTDMGRIYCLQDRIKEWRSDIAHKVFSADIKTDCIQSNSIKNEDDFEPHSLEVIEEVSQFFSPLFQHDAFCAAIESDLPGKSLILLVDEDLSSFPLRLLPQFRDAKGISHDSSIQNLCQRLSVTAGRVISS